MQFIIAYVQPFLAPRVIDELHTVPGVTGATFVDCRGFGRGSRGTAPTAERIFGTVLRVRVKVAVREGDADAVVHAIQTAAHTGQRGDGKVLVLPLDRAKRISTGDEGKVAI